MKRIALTISIVVSFIGLYGQLNPINNLTFYHWYHYQSNCPNFNCFELNWEVPDTLTQDTLVGYNIYQGDQFWRFQDYIGAACVEALPDPCPDGDFMNIWEAYWIKVTAVYNTTLIESIVNDSAFFGGICTNINTVATENITINTNPVAKGKDIIIQFSNKLEKSLNIRVYNNDGRTVEALRITNDMNHVRISTDRFNTGIYNIVIILENEFFSRRVLII